MNPECQKMGGISNGSSSDFAFVPKSEGNTLVVSAWGYSSGTLTFKSSAGQMLTATCETGTTSVNVKVDDGTILDSSVSPNGMELVNTNIDSKVSKVEVD